MELILTIFLGVLAIYFFADVLIIFACRLVAFTLCAILTISLFKLFANLFVWIGMDGQVAWASLFAAMMVGFLTWVAIRAIAARAAMMPAMTMSAVETVSLDSVRTGLVSAFSILVCQATLSIFSGQIAVIPWIAIALMVLFLTVLDVLAPSFLHRIATVMN